MARRISLNATTLLNQITQAHAAAVAAGAAWPASAPSVAALNTAKGNLQTSITDTDAAEAAWKIEAEKKRQNVAECVELMKGVDEATDLLYGPGGAQKNSFGLAPKGSPIDALHTLVEIKVTDGPVPGSLKFDWESIEGASYEVQWSTASDFATMTGSAASASASEFIISGLTPGTQYWMRVRALRGGQATAWSDPATRVAPV